MQQGRHEQLLNSSGPYTELYELQTLTAELVDPCASRMQRSGPRTRDDSHKSLSSAMRLSKMFENSSTSRCEYPAARKASWICFGERRESKLPIHLASARGTFGPIHSRRSRLKILLRVD